MEKLNKFVPLAKVEEQADGTLYVSGIVTAQKPDLDKEVCDYERTKPYYKAQADRMAKITGGVEGMAVSVMPMRAMHKMESIGAGRDMQFDDAAKTIRMVFHVVDSEAVKKFKNGVYIGFSQGGGYVDKWSDPEFPGCTRYIADPSEVSAVDAPCLPGALVESMKAGQFELHKADGSKEMRKFDTEAVTLESLSKQVSQLADALKSKPAETTQTETPTQPSATEVAKQAATGGEEHTQMAKMTDPEDFKKAAKSLHDHLSALKDAHSKVGDHIEKCMQAVGQMSEGEQAEKAAPVVDLHKAQQTEIDGLKKQLAELVEKMAKTPAVLPAHTGAQSEARTEDAEIGEFVKGLQISK